VCPGRAKTLRAELPCAGSGPRVAALRKRLTGHLSVRRKDHFEFGAGRRSGREGLAVEEGCLNLARRLGICSKTDACCDDRYCKSKPTEAQHREVLFANRLNIDQGDGRGRDAANLAGHERYRRAAPSSACTKQIGNRVRRMTAR